MNLLAVGLGGFLGAVGRYGAGQIIVKLGYAGAFPIGTFIVNFLGSFCIGLAAEFFIKNQSMGNPMQLFIMVGIMGGFTTFSTFSLETVNLFQDGKWTVACIYAVVSVTLCIAGVIFGKSLLIYFK